jgi:hypothetical protein
MTLNVLPTTANATKSTLFNLDYLKHLSKDSLDHKDVSGETAEYKYCVLRDTLLYSTTGNKTKIPRRILPWIPTNINNVHISDALAIVSEVATHINEDMKRAVSRDKEG